MEQHNSMYLPHFHQSFRYSTPAWLGPLHSAIWALVACGALGRCTRETPQLFSPAAPPYPTNPSSPQRTKHPEKEAKKENSPQGNEKKEGHGVAPEPWTWERKRQQPWLTGQQRKGKSGRGWPGAFLPPGFCDLSGWLTGWLFGINGPSPSIPTRSEMGKPTKTAHTGALF